SRSGSFGEPGPRPRTGIAAPPRGASRTSGHAAWPGFVRGTGRAGDPGLHPLPSALGSLFGSLGAIAAHAVLRRGRPGRGSGRRESVRDVTGPGARRPVIGGHRAARADRPAGGRESGPRRVPEPEGYAAPRIP